MVDTHKPSLNTLKTNEAPLPSLSACRMPPIESPSQAIPDIYDSIAPANYPGPLASGVRDEAHQEPGANS